MGLFSNITGKYVPWDLNDSERRLRADWAANIDSWERFSLVDRGGGTFSLWCPATGRYVSSDLNTSDGYLKGLWATSIGTWETFQWALTGN